MNSDRFQKGFLIIHAIHTEHQDRNFNNPIGSLTSDYKFNSDNLKTVLSDLQQMKPKVLSGLSMDILEDDLAKKRYA